MKMTAMDAAVRDYIDRIAPEHRPLFDRVHRLILEDELDELVRAALDA
jgi:hypothetical protein